MSSGQVSLEFGRPSSVHARMIRGTDGGLQPRKGGPLRGGQRGQGIRHLFAGLIVLVKVPVDDSETTTKIANLPDPKFNDRSLPLTTVACKLLEIVENSGWGGRARARSGRGTGPAPRLSDPGTAGIVW